MRLYILKFGGFWGAWEWDYVADIAHARYEQNQSLEAEAETIRASLLRAQGKRGHETVQQATSALAKLIEEVRSRTLRARSWIQINEEIYGPETQAENALYGLAKLRKLCNEQVARVRLFDATTLTVPGHRDQGG